MTIIQRLNGTTYDLKQLGIRTVDIDIPSTEYIHNLAGGEDSIGVVDCGSTIAPRPITVSFRAMSNDILDFSLLRDELFNLLRSEEAFYFIDKRQMGKRWLVKTLNSFSIPQRNVFGNFEAAFIAYAGVAESVGTSQDIHKNGINADKSLWGYGMGLIADDASLLYTHTTNDFRIYNAGNVAIHPFEQELKITIDNVVGSAVFLQLKNETNGSTFRVTEAVTNSQIIRLDGANVTINNLQALRRTNRQYIELDPGWNIFKLTGVTSARVAFDFRMNYL